MIHRGGLSLSIIIWSLGPKISLGGPVWRYLVKSPHCKIAPVNITLCDINGNYRRQSFSKYGISYYDVSTADVNIHASNRQIWYRHPNKENTKVRL
jgi:hypothetical protein